MSGDLKRQPLVPKAHPASEIPDPPQRAPFAAAPEPAPPAPTPEPEPASIVRSVPPSESAMPDLGGGKMKQHNVEIPMEMYKAMFRAVAMRNAEAGEKVSTLRSWTLAALQEKLDRDTL